MHGSLAIGPSGQGGGAVDGWALGGLRLRLRTVSGVLFITCIRLGMPEVCQGSKQVF